MTSLSMCFHGQPVHRGLKQLLVGLLVDFPGQLPCNDIEERLSLIINFLEMKNVYNTCKLPSEGQVLQTMKALL